MDPALRIKLLLTIPMFVGGGIYCWRVGIRWTRTTTIKGPPAKIAAVLLFALAGLMLLAVIFPEQAGRIADAADRKLSGGQTHRSGR